MKVTTDARVILMQASPARVLKGDKGDPGPMGPVGPQGERGEVGPQGIQGPQGEQGPQGIQGPKGEIGEVGPQGIQGPKGERGEVGPQGIQGLQGPKGDPGKDAESASPEQIQTAVDRYLEEHPVTVSGYRLIGSIVLSEPATKLEFAIPDGITSILAHFFNKYDSGLSDTYGYFSVNGKSVNVGQNMSLNNGLDQQLALHFELLPDGKAFVSCSKGSHTTNNSYCEGFAPCGWLNAWNGDFGGAITKVAFSQVNPNKSFGAGCMMEVWAK